MSNRASRLLTENILANYAYVLVMGVVTLAATPIYVHRLGPAQWGLVALCMTAQGMLLLLDAGLGQIMPREIARAARQGRAEEAWQVSLKLYGSIAVGACLIGQIGAGAVAGRMMAGQPALQPMFEAALRLVLLQFMFQFPNNAALAFWNGTEQQRLANLRQAGFAAAKHLGALTLVTQWRGDALAYMLPFALISAIECLANAWRLHRAAAPTPPVAAADATPTAPFSVRQLIGSAGGFSGVVVLGMLTSQIDRLWLARVVTAEEFGRYVVAANLALTLMHLQGPIQRAFLPRIVTDAQAAWPLVRRMLILIAVVCLLPCLVAAALARPLLQLWLHDPVIAAAGAPAFALIAVAVGLNGMYGGIYTLFVRDNLYLRLIVLNAAILAAQGLLLHLLTPHLSITTGGLAWLLGSAMQVSFGLFSVLRLRKSARV